MRADLHIHTRYSDGSYTVREALLLAREKGVEVVAFTDHDTTAGTAEALELSMSLAVTVLPAVEISAYDNQSKSKAHVLGYGYRLPATAIDSLCGPVLARRHTNTLRQIHALVKAGYPVSETQVRDVALGENPLRYDPAAALGTPANPVLYKQHIMHVLITEGVADGYYGETYKRLFKGSGVAAGDITYVDAFDAVEAICADGGIPVLAHPGQTNSFDLIDRLVGKGLGGIELHHEDHSPTDHRRVLAAAEQHGLIMTGGSDDHGRFGSVHVLGEIVAPAGAGETLTAVGIPELDSLGRMLRRLRPDLIRAAVIGVDVEKKEGSNHDLVTHFDVAVERSLVDELSNWYPDDTFVTEENSIRDESSSITSPPTEAIGDGERTAAGVWIIDPIDGTTNFASRGDGFAVSIARYVDGQPSMGLVYDVVDDRLFCAATGRGAWANGRRLCIGAGRPVAAAVTDAVVDVSMTAAARLRKSYDADISVLVEGVRAQRSAGSAALGICGVAAGRSDLFLAGSILLWDYAAARIVVEEAGGVFYAGRTADGRFVADSAIETDAVLSRAKHPVLAAATVALADSLSDQLFPDGAPWRALLSIAATPPAHQDKKKAPGRPGA